MSDKRTRAKRKDPKRIQATVRPGESEGAALARTALLPEVQSALTTADFMRVHGEMLLPGLVDALADQVDLVKGGDLSRIEGIMVAQSHTLDSIFNDLARRAIRAEYMDNFDRYMRLALRAQSQCRATLEALAEIKQPRSVSFVNQANIAHGHQQVNNAPARAGETQNPQDEILERQDGERLDTGATSAAGRADPQVEAVAAGDGTEDGGR